MALPYRAVTSGNEKVDGGTILHGGTISSSKWTGKTLRDFAEDSGWSMGYGAKVLAITGAGSATGVQTAKGSGTLAYQPTPEDPQFLIRGYSTTINNITTSMLRIVGSDTQWRQSDKRGRQKAYGSKTITALTDGAWDATGISAQRSNWNSSASSSVTSGVVATLSDTFKLTTNSGSNSSDDAICNVRSSTGADRGELVYMFGAKLPKQDDYKQKTG